MTLDRVPRPHVLLAVIVTVCWGVNFVVVEIGLATFPPLLFAALRFTVVGAAVVVVGAPRASWRVVVGVGLFLSAGQFGLLFVAMDAGLPAGLASLVLQLQAVFTVALAVGLLGEQPSTGQLAGIGCALAGIATIAAGRVDAVPLAAFGPCVGAAASWGAGNVIVRAAKPAAPVALLVWSSLVPPLPLAALSLRFEGAGAWGDALEALDVTGILALLYVVLIATFLGFGAWTWLLARHPAATVAPFTLLVPVTGLATAWLVLDQRPNPSELIGAVIVLVGLGLITGVLRAARTAPATITAPPAESRRDEVFVGASATTRTWRLVRSEELAEVRNRLRPANPPRPGSLLPTPGDEFDGKARSS